MQIEDDPRPATGGEQTVITEQHDTSRSRNLDPGAHERHRTRNPAERYQRPRGPSGTSIVCRSSLTASSSIPSRTRRPKAAERAISTRTSASVSRVATGRQKRSAAGSRSRAKNRGRSGSTPSKPTANIPGGDSRSLPRRDGLPTIGLATESAPLTAPPWQRSLVEISDSATIREVVEASSSCRQPLRAARGAWTFKRRHVATPRASAHVPRMESGCGAGT
jgi:hypothetical protein